MGRQRIKSDSKSIELASKKVTLHSQLLLPPSRSIDISFENISYSVSTSFFSNKRKEILKDVSGLFRSGELTAIMGPSGAGKSSLLNVLSGFIKIGVNGSVYANGVLVKSNRSATKSHSAYIMQEDHFNPFFSVSETMLLAAHLKLARTTSPKSKEFLIDDILDDMALGEARNTRCDRLSGGQKKRLSVCLEMINNPSILYLDEPTSGLDSSSCSLLVTKLKVLSRSGRTVICTIHQPSAAIFSMFDHLYLVSSGRTVYQGDTANILPFLNHIGLSCPVFHNPADFMMDVISGEFGCFTDRFLAASRSKCWRINDSNLKSDNGITLVRDEVTDIADGSPSEWLRYTWLVSKMFKQLHRDKLGTYLKLCLHFLVGLVVGLNFYDLGDNGDRVISNISYFFVCIIYLCFTTMMPAALRFPNEVAVLKKEHFNNWYKFTTYFFALLTVNLPVQWTFSLVFTVISYFLSGQLMECLRILLFTSSLTFNVVISEMIGLVMGTMKQPVNGVFNASILLAAFVALGGFIVFLKDIPTYLYYVSYFGFFRYIFELMVTALYGFERGKLFCPPNLLYCYLRNPKVLITEIGLDERNVLTDIIILTIYTLVVTLITFFRLKYRLKHYY